MLQFKLFEERKYEQHDQIPWMPQEGARGRAPNEYILMIALTYVDLEDIDKAMETFTVVL